jgi:hypothetical protein
MTNDTLSPRRPWLDWPAACLIVFGLIGACEIYKHSTWSHPVDVTLDTGETLHGSIRWGWHDELHVRTQAGELVTLGWRSISFPAPSSLKR